MSFSVIILLVLVKFNDNLPSCIPLLKLNHTIEEPVACYRLLGYCLLIKKLEKMKEVVPVALFRKLYRLRNTQKARLLGLDVGQKYVGLAVSDVTNQSTSPLRSVVFVYLILVAVPTHFSCSSLA